MNRRFVIGGCSFTYGHELSDDDKGQHPSRKSWAYLLCKEAGGMLTPDNIKSGNYYNAPYGDYICRAKAGAGNSSIARRVFDQLSLKRGGEDGKAVLVMWSFLSRYEWAMPRHKNLEYTRWATITPWDTTQGQVEAFRGLSASEPQQEIWKQRREEMKDTNVGPFADSIYKYAANKYHEIYLSWKSIIWLQNLLEKKNIPYMFTLADNELFYDEMNAHKNQDYFFQLLHREFDFSKWFFFGERCMGFNQWAQLNEYKRGTTHPLDQAHEDAVKLMKDKFIEIIGGKTNV